MSVARQLAACLITLSTVVITVVFGTGPVHGQNVAKPAAGPARKTQDSAADALVKRYQSATNPREAQGAFDALKASSLKSPRAAYLCGVLASQPGSVVADRATALRCLELAAKAGIAEAQHALAIQLLADKPGDPRQRIVAERWLAPAAKQLPESVYLLALLKAAQAPDPLQARRELINKAAAAGYAPAQYELGRLLRAHDSAESSAAARPWLEKAAAQQHPDALVDLALLIEAEGRQQDMPRIAGLFAAASLAGSPRGDYELGLRLMHGKGVQKDNERAFTLFRRAASRGYIPAMYATGFALSEAIGTGVDEAAAVEWYRLAAERGYSDAMFALGNSYANGWGAGKNMDVAFHWYCKAAQAGNERGLEMVKFTPANQCTIESRHSK